METTGAHASDEGAIVKYYTRIGNDEFVVDIDKERILVDGEPVEVDLKQSGVPELYSMLLGGMSYELLVEPDRFNYTVTLRGEQYLVQVEDERARRLSAIRKPLTLPDGELAVTAPIPGLVVKVLVAEQMEVQEGQPLVILEAMKMENEIRSPRAGKVIQIKIGPGQRVEQNAALVVLE